MNKHAVVVGAGVGGMTTALRLLRNGWQVDIFEQSARPGGRLNRLSKDGYTFDLGPTIILLPDVLHKLFADLDRRLEDYLDIEAVHPNYRLHFADGTYMDTSSDLREMICEIERLSPKDVPGFMRYLEKLYRRYDIGRHAFIERPMNSLRDVLHPKQLVKLFQLHTLQTARKDIQTFIRDPRLQDALTFQSLYVGISPFQAPSIFNVIGFMELTASGIWYARGGFYAVVEAFVQLLDEFGAGLHLSCRVDEVLHDGRRSTGVRLSDGRIVTADAVVVNADYPAAVKSILPQRSQKRFPAANIDKMEQSCSGFMLYLGLNRRYEEVRVHNLYFSADFEQYTKEVFDQGILPTDPSIYTHMPTLIDDSVAPPGKDALYILVPAPNLHVGRIDWERDAKKFRDQIVAKLSSVGYENLEEHIEFEAMFTPADWAREFSLSGGAAFGALPKLSQSAYWRPSLKSDTLSDLYFVGASTHPGSGVTIVMTGSDMLEKLMATDMPHAFPAVTGRSSSESVEGDATVAPVG